MLKAHFRESILRLLGHTTVAALTCLERDDFPKVVINTKESYKNIAPHTLALLLLLPSHDEMCCAGLRVVSSAFKCSRLRDKLGSSRTCRAGSIR